jgi:single-stranded-DNA-specific exonuclease
MLDSHAEPPFSYLLGIVHSATQRHWLERLDAAGRRTALAMSQVAGLSDVLARVIAGRGIALSELDGFLVPRLRDLLPDPLQLADMDRAAAFLAESVMRRDRIAIFGDYDVDGACSAALLGEYLAAFGVPFEIYIPDRIFEGYGPNSDAIRGLAEAGATVLVTVDCGSTSFEPLAEARRLGLKTIILDHHQLGEAQPNVDALVNPNRQDDLSGLGHLCAAGVVFLTLVALNRTLREAGFFSGRPEPDLFAALDLVALATVADVVPLKGLNRAFVAQGLRVMRSRGRIGLRALMDSARLDGPVEPYHLGFVLGPRINAGGRIGNAALGAKLLLTRDESEAARIAEELELLNRDRQAVERGMVEQAMAQADRLFASAEAPDGPAIIVTSSTAWHPGIVGLVAARLKERFQRPAFAFAFSAPGLRDGEGSAAEVTAAMRGTGSGRSVPGIDLGEAVRAAVEAGLLVKGGGHAMAAGATITQDRLSEFHDFLEERLRLRGQVVGLAGALEIDSMLTAAGATSDLVSELERAGPYGQANPEPVFVFPDHRLVDCFEVGSGGHLRLKLQSADGATLGAIAFRASGHPLGDLLIGSKGNRLHFAGSLTLDRYGGRNTVSLRLIDAARPV